MADDRGALLLPGLFMTLTLLSLTYVVVGVARTLLAQEGMQDAADAAAFSAAVFHARGMNLMALLNLLMALLVAILVALRLIQGFFTIASVLLYGFAWLGGSTIPLAQGCQQVAQRLGNAYQKAKDPVLNIVGALHTVQDATKVLVPFGAIGSGFVEAAKDHEPAKGAVALPTAISLPVEDDEFSVLCGRSTEMAVGGALDGFFLGLGMKEGVVRDKITAPIESASQSMGKALSGYLCGGKNDGGGPPSYTVEEEKQLPRPEGLDDCVLKEGDFSASADEEAQVSPSCRRAQEDLERGQPDRTPRGTRPADGGCLRDCGYDGPYERLAREARQVCNPAQGRPRPYDYVWQKTTGTLVFRFQGRRWEEEERHVERLELVEGDDPPCGPGSGIDSAEWNEDSGGRDRETPRPLCSSSQAFPSRPISNQLHEISFVEATRLFSCKVKEERKIQLAEEGDSFGGGESDDKVPHKMEENVELGDEAFQIRALAFGSGGGPTKPMREGVKLVLWGRKSPALSDGLFTFSKVLSLFSYAQAEYYFDHDGSTPREDWLWEMRWRARLVRFRIPDEDDQEAEEQRQENNAARSSSLVAEFGGNDSPVQLDQACDRVGLSCPSQDTLNELNTWSLH